MPTETTEDASLLDNEAIDEELGDLAVDILLLSQELINTKMKLESLAKNGWMEMAKARYIMGPNSVSSLQLPSVEQEKPVRAKVRSHLDQCIRSDGHVRYNYFSLAVDGQRSTVDMPDGVRHRRTTDPDQQKQQHSPGTTADAVDNSKTEDPIRWFGMLPPAPLKQSQKCFQFCVEAAIEAANIQCEIRGVQDRIKFLNRQRGGQQSETPPTDNTVDGPTTIDAESDQVSTTVPVTNTDYESLSCEKIKLNSDP